MNQRFQNAEITAVSSKFADNELYRAVQVIGLELEAELHQFGLCPEECFTEALELLSMIAERGEDVLSEIDRLWLTKHNEYRRLGRDVDEEETRKTLGIVIGFVILALNSSRHPFYRYVLTRRLTVLVACHPFGGWSETLGRIFSVALPDGWFDSFLQQSPADDTDIMAEPVRRKGRKTPKPKLTDSTYRYKWKDTETARIVVLYQILLRRGLIASDTSHEDFEALFSGEQSTARVKWLAPQSWLWYMLRVMESKAYITVDEGSSIWMIASSHFVGKDGRLFTNVSFSKLKPPKKAVKALDLLVETLNAAVSVPSVDIMDDDPDAELWASIRDRGFDMND